VDLVDKQRNVIGSGSMRGLGPIAAAQLAALITSFSEPPLD